MLYNIFFHYQLETNNFAEQNIIPFIPFFSTLVNLSCLCISLGLRGKLDTGTVKCFLVRRFINCKLSDNKDIEQVRSIKFYEFCILYQLNDSKSCIVNFYYCSFACVFKELRANFLPSRYFSMNFLVRVGKLLFNSASQTKK